MRKSSFVSAVLAIVLLAVAVPAAAANRWVKVINEASSPIFFLYATNTGNRNWGNDLLGRRSIPAGYNLDINFDDGSGACIFDFKAVLKDGRKITRMNLDVCTTETWTIYED